MQARAVAVRSARAWLGQRRLTLHGRPLPADCWSLPAAAFGRAGVVLDASSAEALYRKERARGKLFRDRLPRPGDLVFLSSASGHPAHVGLVGEVDRDGTVTVYQRMARGVVAYRMNARHPDEATAPAGGRRWNDGIVDPGGSPRLAGQLFAGYAAVLR